MRFDFLSSHSIGRPSRRWPVLSRTARLINILWIGKIEGWRPLGSRQTELAHDAHKVVAEPLFQNLSLLVPVRDRAELHTELLVRWRDYFPARSHHGPLVGSGVDRDRARPVALAEHRQIRPVPDPVVGKRLEVLDCLPVMGMPSLRRLERSEEHTSELQSPMY